VYLCLIKKLVISTHENYGHFGAHKIADVLLEHFVWPNLRRDVRKIIASCAICQKTKRSNVQYKGDLQCNVSEAPGELVAIDLYGSLPRAQAGMMYLLVMIDVFSKFVAIYPLRRATTDGILRKILLNFVPSLGKMAAILSDRGTQFTAKRWSRVLNAEGIAVKLTSAWHPASNPAERGMREIGRICRTYCNEKHTTWLKFVPLITRWINITTHESTGVTPFELQHGRRPDREIQ
jgi:hypothetical protein